MGIYKFCYECGQVVEVDIVVAVRKTDTGTEEIVRDSKDERILCDDCEEYEYRMNEEWDGNTYIQDEI